MQHAIAHASLVAMLTAALAAGAPAAAQQPGRPGPGGPAAAAGPPAAACPERPAPGTALLYAESGWRGTCRVLPPGVHNDVGPAKSLRLASFTDAVICRRTAFGDVDCRKDFGSVNFLPGDERQTLWLQILADRRVNPRCEPQDEEVAISSRSDGLGPCVRQRPGRYPVPAAVGLAEGERRYGSPVKPGPLQLETGDALHVRSGRRVQARLCSDINLSGACRDLAPQATASAVRLRSMWVFADCRPAPDEVALFAETRFAGPCTLQRGAEVRSLASTLPDGAQVRSLRLGSGVVATLCDGEDFNGTCAQQVGDAAMLPTRPLSLRLAPRPAPPAASAASAPP